MDAINHPALRAVQDRLDMVGREPDDSDPRDEVEGRSDWIEEEPGTTVWCLRRQPTSTTGSGLIPIGAASFTARLR